MATSTDMHAVTTDQLNHKNSSVSQSAPFTYR